MRILIDDAKSNVLKVGKQQFWESEKAKGGTFVNKAEPKTSAYSQRKL